MILIIICHRPLEMLTLAMGVEKKALYFVGPYSILQI